MAHCGKGLRQACDMKLLAPILIANRIFWRRVGLLEGFVTNPTDVHNGIFLITFLATELLVS